MPSADWEASREGERHLRHKASASSDLSRSLVPMWDSSDPERAPPPLPLHPQSPSIGSSRTNASAAIQSAHAALTEKARESGLVSSALAKRAPETSPERPATRGSAHRRMQSLQPGSVRDRSLYLESQHSSPGSPEKRTRPSTPVKSRDALPDTRASPEKDARSAVATPTPGPSLTPIVRPSVRRPPHSILGENTPPQSATMLALQNMAPPAPKEAESPLANVTNGSTALVRVQPSFDALSGQILSLTNIATALQKDMAQLSRRSRDNATDLMSLKEATNARDEDIRKSLRDLVSNVHEANVRGASRDPFSSGLLIDSKPHGGSQLSKPVRPFSLPRIPSPNSFAASIDRESMGTPSLYGPEAPATIALLEKIIRDMGTKDGQDLLVSRLSEIAENLRGLASAEKVDDLLRQLRGDQTMVPHLGGGGGGRGSRPRNFSFSEEQSPHPRELEYDRSRAGPMTQRVERLLQDQDNRRSSAPPSRAADLINDDILKIIRSVKDSVAQGGGMTAEVKALVRELRGEVLGMGREIGRRLDELAAKSSQTNAEPTKEEIAQTIDDGLGQMKEHMDDLLREFRRQSAASTSKVTTVDYQEIYNAVRAALKDSSSSKAQTGDLSRDDVIEAVKEAWEDYKPEIELQHLGLERDEVLACLKEGLKDYAPRDARPAGATRDEVFKAVVEGLKHFVPPRMDSTASLSRNEILDAVRECLEEFEFPVAPSAINAELTRDDMIHAVREGLSGIDLGKAGAVISHQPGDGEVAARLSEIMELMRAEFKAVSEEAKQNVAATGRDTEQVLDATKDGFEKLRTDMESYVQRAAGAAAQEEFLDGLLRTLDGFRSEVAELVFKASSGSREELQSQLESFRDTVNSSIVPVTPQGGSNREILKALRDGLDSLRAEVQRPHAGTTQVLDALQEGFGELRVTVDKIVNRPADLTANDEILDALKAGLDNVRADIDTLREQTRNDAVATVAKGAVVPADAAKHDDIKNLEVLITQLRIKIEALEPTDNVSKDDLEELLRNVRESAAPKQGGDGQPNIEGGATREDVQAIETILRNTKSRLDDLIDGEQAVRKEHVDALETLVLEARESLSALSARVDGVSRREDIESVESMLGQVATGIDEIRERADKEFESPERVTKSDIEAIETLCLELKGMVDSMAKTDLATVSTKEDMKAVDKIVRELRDRLDVEAESSSKALSDRQAEIVGVGERVTEVKMFLKELHSLVKTKLEGGAEGIDSLAKLLETVSATIEQNANVGRDLGEMFEVMKTEFLEAKEGVVGLKVEADEKAQQTTDILGAKIDERVGELMAKYDEMEAVLEERAKAGETRDEAVEAGVLGTKQIADDLKTLIDTLGSTVTDSLEKMEEASKTVFGRVEDLMNRSEENHSDHKAEHQQTRDQVKQAISVVEGLQGHVCEYQPKIFDAVKDVLLIVGQHYEHSKTTATDIQDKIEESKLPEQPLLPPPEPYDDTEVHVKLDKLMDNSHAAGKAFAQLDTLDKVHQQVRQTAAEISGFLSTQTKRINDEHEDREKTLHDTTIALERRLVEKDHVEDSIASLREEEARLREAVAGLKNDQEILTRQKTRLTADVASLETALRLRRDELYDMEGRAEGLERRILEGVMDHSRVLLMSKSTKGKDAMSRKRVQIQDPAKPTGSEAAPRSSLGVALAAKRNLIPPNPVGASRRILSLGQMTSNVAAGGFKRSQSVRTVEAGKGMRKNSWAGSLGKTYGDLDKENMLVRESDEERDDGVVTPVDDRSDTETLRRSSRRSSRGTMTIMEGAETESELDSRLDDETGSEFTESVVGMSTVDGDESNALVLHSG